MLIWSARGKNILQRRSSGRVAACLQSRRGYPDGVTILHTKGKGHEAIKSSPLRVL